MRSIEYTLLAILVAIAFAVGMVLLVDDPGSGYWSQVLGAILIGLSAFEQYSGWFSERMTRWLNIRSSWEEVR